LVKEGIEVAEAVQDRHDGFKRNPFMHDESGVHYARAMSSWSLLLALSGFEFDGVEKKMAFSPKVNLQNFSTFWSTGSAWGTLSIKNETATLSVLYGDLQLKTFALSEGLDLKKNEDYRLKSIGENSVEAHFKNNLKLAAGEQYEFELNN